MTTVVILNIIFAALVVGGILALLGGAIVSDRTASVSLTSRRRAAVRERTRCAAGRRLGRALDAGA